MKIRSTSFKNNEFIPSRYTCDGKNISPPLIFEGIPEGAVSLVLIVDDPDASGRIFTHWVVYNIDPGLRDIPENNFHGNEFHGKNSFENLDYSGPCPPSGTHRYFFRLYALDSMMTLYKPDIEELQSAMEAHIVDSAELVGLYHRS